jgi:hypothetical protein
MGIRGERAVDRRQPRLSQRELRLRDTMLILPPEEGRAVQANSLLGVLGFLSGAFVVLIAASYRTDL